MADQAIDTIQVLELLNQQYGTKLTAQYYLRQAKQAAVRAKLALAEQNPYSLGAEAQIMVANIDLLASLLGSDDRRLDEKL
jgi:hypothetical protein